MTDNAAVVAMKAPNFKKEAILMAAILPVIVVIGLLAAWLIPMFM